MTPPVKDAALSPLLRDHLQKVLELDQPLAAADFQKNVSEIDPKNFFGSGVRWTAPLEGEILSIAYFEDLPVRASAIIHDHDLGTIGLVHVIPNEEKHPATWIKDRIEAACYLRHICLEGTPQNRPHVSVELVFVLQEEDRATSVVLGSALRDLIERSSLLHTIGIGVLVDQVRPDDQAIRRAFPWLLRATRSWLGSRRETVKRSSEISFISLHLENFRLAGPRRLRLRNDSSLQVVHGQNGSGKSSLSEALELVVTGKIARIGSDRNSGDKDYDHILRPRGSAAAAPVLKLNAGTVTEQSFMIGKGGIEGSEPLAAGLHPLSFRLDQHEAAMMSRSSREERAATFLEAFFPEKKHLVESYHKMSSDLEEIQKSIPEKLLEGSEHHGPEIFDFAARYMQNPRLVHALLVPERIAPEENGMISGNHPFDWGNFFDHMPHYRDQGLGSLDPHMIPSAGFMEQYIGKLDVVWYDLKSNAERYAKHCAVAADFLERLGGWRGDGLVRTNQPVHETYPERVNAWLRECASCDLLTKELEISLVQANLSEMDSDLERFLRRREEDDENRVSSLKDALARHLARRDRAEASVKLGDVESSARRGEQRNLKIEDYEVRALNFVGPLIDIDEEQFGDAVREILDSGQPGRLTFRTSASRHERYAPGDSRKVLLGTESADAENSLADSVKLHESFFATISARLSTLVPSDCHARLRSLAEARRQVSQELKKNFDSFQDSINGPLNDAINEFTALMTPARWAYPGTKTKFGRKSVVHEVEGRPAALVLNTAELNTNILALFILCNFGRTDNPLRTIVLDDPFENMDELTTTHVARALTRFLRLWMLESGDNTSRILLLLHGAENVERMREETPCAVHFLPWLTPHIATAGSGVQKGRAATQDKRNQDGRDNHPGEIYSEGSRFPIRP